MPSVPLYYVADDAHAPYGEKQPSFVQERADTIVQQLIGENVTMVVAPVILHGRHRFSQTKFLLVGWKLRMS